MNERAYIKESQVEIVARAMFHRRCEEDGAAEGVAILVWETEPEVRAFWLAEASFVFKTILEIEIQTTNPPGGIPS